MDDSRLQSAQRPRCVLPHQRLCVCKSTHERRHRPLERLYPQPGYVEQDPYAVAQSVSGAITAAIDAAGCAPNQIIACGITSQRNTDFAWDKNSGLPIGNAVTWQDLRTVPVLREIEELPFAGEFDLR